VRRGQDGTCRDASGGDISRQVRRGERSSGGGLVEWGVNSRGKGRKYGLQNITRDGDTESLIL